MCTPFSPVGRLSVTPPLGTTQIARLANGDARWFPCDHGCCLLPDDLPDAWALRELLADLGEQHHVAGLVVHEADESVVGIFVSAGVVSTSVLWRHATPCRELQDVIPLALRLLKDAG